MNLLAPATRDDVRTHGGNIAPGNIASARLQKLKDERLKLRAQLRHLASLRLQRWYRARRWRCWILPRQLKRIRLLLSSCITLQRACRKTLGRRKLAREHCAPIQRQLSASEKNGEAPPLQSQDAGARAVSFVAEPQDELIAPVAPAKFIESEDGTLKYLGVAAQAYSSQVERCGSRIEQMKQCSRQCPATDSLEIPDAPLLREAPMSPEALRRAATCWRGYRVRRALGSRGVQGKIQLRHDLYLLISDVEGRSQLTRDGAMPQRLAPWVDVLYNGLDRLQNEILNELRALINGGTRLCASPRCPLIWRGWSRDLLRLPRLMLSRRSVKREFSPSLCSEPSLLAYTAYQAITPPESPATMLRAAAGAMEARPLVYPPASAQHDDWLQFPWGCVVTTPPTAMQSEPVQSSGCISTLTPQLISPSGSPRGRNSKLPPSQDWTKVKPRVRCWASPQTRSAENLRAEPPISMEAMPDTLSTSASAPGHLRGGRHEILLEAQQPSLAPSASSSTQGVNLPSRWLRWTASSGQRADSEEVEGLASKAADDNSLVSRVRPGDLSGEPELSERVW